MTVSNQTPYVEYNANGSTTNFALTFDCDNANNLIVKINGIEVIDTWTLQGSTVVFITAPIANSIVSIERDTPLERTTDYQAYDDSFSPKPVNKDFDSIWHVLQEFLLKIYKNNYKYQELIDKLIDGNVNGLPAEILARIAADENLQENIDIEKLRAYAAEQNINTAMDIEKVRVNSELANRYTKQEAYNRSEVDASITAVSAGHKAYATLAAAQAAQATFPANIIVEITDDGANNGAWRWNGTTLTKSTYDPLTQAKSYTNVQIAVNADVLFKRLQNPFNNASMPVTRYLTDGSSNTYANRTYQTAITNGVGIAVTAAGSAAIKHYFNTGYIAASFTAEFTINAIGYSGSGEGVGVGFLKNGVIENYALTEGGNIVKISNQNSTLLTSGLGNYVVGSKIKFVYAAGNLSIYRDGVLKGVVGVAVGDTILIGQVGFSQYSVSLYESASDPVRDYVTQQITLANSGAIAPAYYAYNLSTQTLTAYSQVKNDLFVGFSVVHEVDMSDLVYKDYWRITQAAFYQLTSGVMQPTTKIALGVGESEFVFKQNATKDDFTGGYHGDELVTDIKFLADGIIIPTTANIALTAAKKLEYFEKSTMHESPSGGVFVVGHPIVAYHTKHTEFKEGGYKVQNYVKWNYAGTLSTLYHGISCISKDVATTVFTDDTYTDQAMTGSLNMYFNAVGARLYRGRNDANKLAVEASAYQQLVTGADELSTLFVHDRAADSKYYRQSPARTVEVGELHQSYFECKFLAI